MLQSIPWWLSMQVLGAAAFPWTLLLFRGLPDRGYGLSKILGLLLVAYAYWAVVMAGTLPNSTASLIVVLALFLAASGLIGWRHREEILLFLRYHRRLLAVEEAVFTGTFFLFVGFRVLAPDIHLTTALTVTTEQPMDLAFLSGILRSPTFPPADPWLAGHPISYYYLGHLALSLPARLSGALPTVAYSVGLSTVFALAAVGAFSLASNAVTLGRLDQRGGRAGGLAVLAGLAAAAFLLVAGNLVAVGKVFQRIGAIGEDGLLGDPNWWWGPSRVIVDGTHAEPIDEVPAFSFVLGDLHPHLMAIPFALLALGLALGWLSRSEAPDARWPLRQTGEMALTGLIVGALGFANTWDLPTYFGVLAAAIAVRRLWQGVDKPGAAVMDILVPSLTLLALALLLYLPFYFNLSGQSQGILPVASTGTRAVHYLLLWGPLLGAAVLPIVAASWARAEGRVVTGRNILVLLLIALLPLLVWTVTVLLWRTLPIGTSPTGAQIIGRWILLGPATALLLLALIAVFPSQWEEAHPPGRTFDYLLVGAAAVTVLVPELFFVRDLFGTRMNTVFKVHYQTWVLLSLAAGIGLAWLLVQVRPRQPWARLASGAGFAVVVLLAFLALGYGTIAAATRIRWAPGPSASLDGLAFYRERYPNEAAAIEWLRETAPPGSVVLEAVGNDYSDYGRVSAITGLPTPLGWEGHELQWRSGFELFATRRGDVAAVYEANDLERARQVLGLYGVDYIYVGRLEREAYGPDVAERLERLLPEAETTRWGDVMVMAVPRE